ncbi:hypothetical protein KAR91_60240, partial [Candidatus Pacearchaeota archaeon]|nr:hypothetical protein [Candidatus Pacearchaeota archaeon]
MAIVKKSTFIDLCHECEFNTTDIRDRMKDLYPGYNVSPARIEQRLANYRRKGLLPLSSGNSVSSGEILKGSSTLYDGNGKIKQQWLKTDVPKEQHLNAFRKAISDLSKTLPSLPSVQSPVIELDDNLATLYISNDVHFGALMWDKESGKDWNVDEATKTLQEAYDYLFSCSPDSKVGIICDLGDLT